MRSILLFVLFVLGCSDGSSGGAECTSRAECDGDRICVDGRCVDRSDVPDAGAPEADAGPTECAGPCIEDSRCVAGECVSYGDGEGDPSCTLPPEPFVVSPRVLCHWPPVGEPITEGPEEWRWARRVASTVVSGTFVPGEDEFGLPPTWFVFATGSVLNTPGEPAPEGTWQPGGVLRVLDPQTCRLVDTLDEVPVAAWFQPPAIGDLDGDGVPEIVAQAWDEQVPDAPNYQSSGRLVAWRYDADEGRFRVWRQSTVDGAPEDDLAYTAAYVQMSGPTIADLDDDGVPEVMLAGRVYDAELRRLTGEAPPVAPIMLSRQPGPGGVGGGPYIIQQDVIADLNDDGRAELVYGHAIYSWNPDDNAWEEATSFAPPEPLGLAHGILADMGEFPESRGADRPEVVAVGYDGVRIQSTTGVVLRRFELPTGDRGGSAPSIANVDDDPVPEILVGVDAGLFVYDLGCDVDAPGPECGRDAGTTSGHDPLPRGVRWADRPPNDNWDYMGATTFDFDADGRLEVVYADECFLRVYDGPTGDVIYSHWRPSRTASEVPIVAGAGGGADTVLAIGLHTSYFCTQATGVDGTPPYDPQFPGLSCRDDRDCFGGEGSCRDGRCRCTEDAECCAPGDDCNALGYACHPAPEGDDAGNTCRAIRVPDDSAYAASGALEEGIDILTDTLGRWATARPWWNQDAYSVTNIRDDGTIPRTSEVEPNWATPGLNNARSNVAGRVSATAVSDLTVRDVELTCEGGAPTELSAAVCNRGARAATVGQVVHFESAGAEQCRGVTDTVLPVGGCLTVRCAPTASLGAEVQARVNPDGVTRECGDATNNVSASIAASCP